MSRAKARSQESGVRRLPWLNVRHQVTHPYFQSFGDPDEGIEGNVDFPALHFADVVRMQVRQLGKLFLCEPGGFPVESELIAKCLAVFERGDHDAANKPAKRLLTPPFIACVIVVDSFCGACDDARAWGIGGAEDTNSAGPLGKWANERAAFDRRDVERAEEINHEQLPEMLGGCVTGMDERWPTLLGMGARDRVGGPVAIR